MSEHVDVKKKDTLPLEDATDLLLALLYAPGASDSLAEPIEGRTRMQKLMFLLHQDVGPKQLVQEAKEYEYDAYKMGPYSKELTKTLEELQSAGIIKTERLEYVLTDDTDPSTEEIDSDPSTSEGKRVESLRYKLSHFGRDIAKQIWEGLTEQQQDGLKEFKSYFNSLSLRQLLIFTYDRFPDFTTESVIKDDLEH